MSEVRVRFAPSPTGELHIGGARTALFNYLFARSTGGTFVLRIDDTDLERSSLDYIDKLIASMKWIGLNWDEGPYYQSKRLDEYTREAERLIAEKKAYRCYCSIDELTTGREEARKDKKAYLYPGTCRNLSPQDEESFLKEGRAPVIRLITPDHGATVVEDEIKGTVSFENVNLDDFIIIKSNGLPTYNYASVVDDLQMNISHVIRGEEHLSNTPRQQLCALALGYKLPYFAHVPMILAPDRSKLSKRHGATSVEEFKREGYLPEALVNYMALLGWSPGGDQELFSLENLVSEFNLKRVNITAAIYDINKLAWMNSHYIRDYDLDKLAEAALPFFEEKGLLTASPGGPGREFYKKVIDIVRERARTLAELVEASTYFFTNQYSYDEEGVRKFFGSDDAAGFIRHAVEGLSSLKLFSTETTESKYHTICEELGISLGSLIQPSRLALTGRTGGPGLFEIMALLGREETIERLEKAADYISNMHNK